MQYFLRLEEADCAKQKLREGEEVSFFSARQICPHTVLLHLLKLEGEVFVDKQQSVTIPNLVLSRRSSCLQWFSFSLHWQESYSSKLYSLLLVRSYWDETTMRLFPSDLNILAIFVYQEAGSGLSVKPKMWVVGVVASALTCANCC